MKHRIVGILTDTNHYYESHEQYDASLKSWCGVEFFDLTESDAADRMRRSAHHLDIDVSDVTGMDGEPVSSRTIMERTDGEVEKRVERLLGNTEWETLTHHMDDELREKLHVELAPCSNEEFLRAYVTAHAKTYGEWFYAERE